jgi:serine O-acetyltransferase
MQQSTTPQLRGDDPNVPPLPRGETNENPPELSLWALLREDYLTNDHDFRCAGFWAVAVHRFGNWRMGFRWKIVRAPLTILYSLMRQVVQRLWGIKLAYVVKVGRRVKIEHFGGMILGARSIGNDVVIRQNTTLGVAHRGANNCKPIIEDRVDIGCGACILGYVRVGHDSVIGANAVVIRDVPPHSLAVGVPARIIPRTPKSASSHA